MVTVRTKDVYNEIRQRIQEIEGDIQSNRPSERTQANVRKLKTLLGEFELAPKQLDQELQYYITTISLLFLQCRKPEVSESLAELIYTIAKIRGYRFVANYFSSDVYLLPTLVERLSQNQIEDYDCTCFTLLLWLSNLVLSPFPLVNVGPQLVPQLLSISVRFLSVHANASKTQRIASILLALLINRPDCTVELNTYVETTLDSWTFFDENSKLGHLMAINQILKRNSNASVSRFLEPIHSQIITYEITRLTGNDRVSSISVLFLIKVSSKLARFYIANEDYENVTSIVNCIVNGIMGPMAERFDVTLRESTAKKMSDIVRFLSIKAKNYASQLAWYMVRQLKIPTIVNSEVYLPDLELSLNKINLANFHTVLLFLGFLALTKSLPREIIPCVLSLVHQTAFLSQRRSSIVQGTHLRDASCFCWWALFKMLNENEFVTLLQQFPMLSKDVFADLTKVAIFDEEFTLRRCGIAVLQEFIGRHGSEFFSQMLPCSHENEIGEVTLSILELFGSSTVSSLKDSHGIIHKLVDLGVPKSQFLPTLLAEVTHRDSPFSSQKLGATHLVRLLLRDEQYNDRFNLLKDATEMDAKKLIVDKYLGSPVECATLLYALGELQSSELLSSDDLQRIVAQQIKFDFHLDNHEKGEAILHWFNALGRAQLFDLSRYFETILSISRSNESESLKHELIELFSNENVSVGDKELAVAFDYLKRGNVLLALAIPYQRLAPEAQEQFISILLNTSVEAESRALLIKGISQNVEMYDYHLLRSAIYALLNDYTITNQGDVGLKVRLAAIEFIMATADNKNLIYVNLKLRLLRIAGEAMDRLRTAAFKCLCTLDGIEEFKDRYNLYLNDYELYFDDLFSLSSLMEKDYESAKLSEALWEGIVHCAGAQTGVNSLINSSFKATLKYCRGSDVLGTVFQTLLALLKIPPGKVAGRLTQRKQKSLIASLNLFSKFFEAAAPLTRSMNFEALYIRAYNLHINTLNLFRIGAVIRIFQYLGSVEIVPLELQIKARDRLCWLFCRHHIEKVRSLAGEALFEIENEISQAPHSPSQKFNHKDTSTELSKLQSMKTYFSSM